MNQIVRPYPANPLLPDHTQLPETDGAIVQNFQEHPQAMLLTDTLQAVLDRLHPDGQYAIGQDSGIYYRITQPPLDGCKAPDWYYIPNVPPLLNGAIRRSYVLWQEVQRTVLLIEFVSGDGSEERDTTPQTGKFWVYERAVLAAYYAMYEVDPGQVELYRLSRGRYRRVRANRRGHFPVAPLGIELGIWRGRYRNQELPWLRGWDARGQLLPTSTEMTQAANERAEMDRQRAAAADVRAAAAEERSAADRQRAEELAARLRALGIDPEERS